MAPRKTTTSTTSKSATAKKAPAKKAAPAAKAAPKRVATARKTSKTIRNLRGTVVHLRLFSQNPKDPYRVALNPRGQYGDTTTIPATLIDDPTYLAAVGILVEIITPAEEAALKESYGPIGYLGRTDAPEIIYPDDATVLEAPNWDGKGRLPQNREEVKRTASGKQASEREFDTGMHTVDIPGSDAALHALLKAGASAMPADVSFDRRVTIEHAKGE